MSGWWKSLPNGLPNVVSPPKSGHRRAGKGREFPWRCNVDTIAMDLKVSWEMSVKDADPFLNDLLHVLVRALRSVTHTLVLHRDLS